MEQWKEGLPPIISRASRVLILGSLLLTAKQKELLERAKTFAATEAESMVPRRKSLHSWKSVFYGVTKKIGLTRKQLGVTPHSLRHGYANREYARVTGRLSPVQGGALVKEDPAADRAARELVADELGHSRPSIAAAYVGGTRVPRDGVAEQSGGSLTVGSSKGGPRQSCRGLLFNPLQISSPMLWLV